MAADIHIENEGRMAANIHIENERVGWQLIFIERMRWLDGS